MLDPSSLTIPLMALLVTVVAAVVDARRGVIPNRLTLPILAVAAQAHLLFAGPGALLAALLGAGLCGLVPLLLFALRAMGGGDVKLLAALGALAGPALGMRIQLAGFLVAGAFAIVQLIACGGLRPALAGSVRLFTGKRPSRDLTHSDVPHLRFGPPLAVATAFVVLAQVLP